MHAEITHQVLLLLVFPVAVPAGVEHKDVAPPDTKLGGRTDPNRDPVHDLVTIGRATASRLPRDPQSRLAVSPGERQRGYRRRSQKHGYSSLKRRHLPTDAAEIAI